MPLSHVVIIAHAQLLYDNEVWDVLWLFDLVLESVAIGRKRENNGGTGAESTRNTVPAYYHPSQLDNTWHDTQLLAIKLANVQFTIEIQVQKSSTMKNHLPKICTQLE